MGFDQYHEPAHELSEETRTFTRMIASLAEDSDAINSYEQRISVEKNREAKAIMQDAQEEAFKQEPVSRNLQTGRFDPVSLVSQVAVKLNKGRDDVRVGVISLDNNLKIRLPKLVTLPGVACSSGGLSVGNFARTEPVRQYPSKTQFSLKFQLTISTPIALAVWV
jgi:hypothetical protein